MSEEQKGVGPRRCAQDGCGVPSDLVLVDPDGIHADACFSHAPWLEDARALARRKGGLRLLGKLRRNTFLTEDELGGELVTPADAQRRAQIICDAVTMGKLGSSAASVALKALEAWLKAYELVDLAAQVRALERRSAERDAEAERARRAESPRYLGRDT